MDNLGVRLKSVRLSSGLTLREMARRVNVSPSFVSQIENGKAQPSVATLYAFSKLLGVSIDEFFGDREPEDRAHAAAGQGSLERASDRVSPSNAWQLSEYANRVSVVHPSHRPRLDMAEGVVWERLAATPERGVNFMEIVYAPGATSSAGGELQSHEGYEYGYVVSGLLEVTIGDEIFTLNAGESLGFDSSIAHVFKNIGTDDMHGVWFVHGK